MLRFLSTTRRTATIVAATLLAAGCAPTEAAKETREAQPAVRVPVAVVSASAVDAFYEAVGTVQARAASTIQSKATGHVMAVHAKEGDHVTKGQVLVELDAREAQAQLQRAESALRAARDGRREADRAVQAAAHAQDAADAASDLARATYERYAGLNAEGVVSRQAYDEARARWRASVAEAARAGELIASVRARRDEADARIQQAEAEVANARTFLTYTTITAPFDGIVARKSVDVGDLAAPGTPLLEIETTDQYRLEALVDESELGRVRQGEEVPVVVDAVGPEPLTGTVVEIVPSADRASRTFVVKVALAPHPALKSGLFGRARFPMGQRDTLTVPASAVTRRGQLTQVYAVGDDGVARMRLVTVGEAFDDRVEVLSGLEPGERVVADRVEQVRDGTRIEQG